MGTVYLRDRMGKVLGRIKKEMREKKGESGWIVGRILMREEREALEDGEEGKSFEG